MNSYNVMYHCAMNLGKGGSTHTLSTGSHHISCSRLPHLNMMSLTATRMPLIGGYIPEQTKQIYNLGAECQELVVQLTKEFHTFAGLEAKAYETVMEGWPELATVYNVLMSQMGKCDMDKCKADVQKLCSKTEKAWFKTNLVIFDHQLEFDAKLVSFLISAEKNLQAQ